MRSATVEPVPNLGTVSLLVDAVRFYCDGSLWKELVTTGGGPQVSPESNKPRIQGRRNRVDDPLGYFAEMVTEQNTAFRSSGEIEMASK